MLSFFLSLSGDDVISRVQCGHICFSNNSRKNEFTKLSFKRIKFLRVVEDAVMSHKFLFFIKPFIRIGTHILIDHVHDNFVDRSCHT
jgi:hypothetical protein